MQTLATHAERERGADPGPDVRDEAQERAEQAPEPGIRQTDQPHADADGRAVQGVHGEVREQVACDALPGLLERLGRDAEPGR